MPDISALRKKGDYNIQPPSVNFVNFNGSSFTVKRDLTGSLDGRKREEPKEESMQMNSLITQLL